MDRDMLAAHLAYFRELGADGIQRVALVTSAIHMPRSRQAFEAAGFTVIPASTHYFAQRPFTPGQLAPGAGALVVSHLSLREWIARGWYRFLGS